ncbi:MAG: tripartite tricarboxylate transporter permease [Actinomycetota bacterium]|nr:tripartite tricarboxylate transporter permease [Actinomycetota bacterium]
MVETINGVLGAIASIGVYGLVLVVIGVLLGLLVGVLPGLTFVMGVLLLVPFTYSMETGPALILMLALYVAGTYGGALTAILLNIPGEPNNVPLLWDGHGMARRGRAAEALGWAALAALVGGLVSWAVLVFAAKPFASVALQLSSPEYFVIVLLGLASVLALTETSVVAATTAMFVGMLVSTVGVDPVTGTVRYDFGTTILRDGIDFLAVMIGIYALGEVITRFGENFGGQVAQQPASIRTTIPGVRAIKDRGGSIIRGILTGSLMGTVPGAGATVASFVSYGLEKQFGKHKREVGQASPSGIVAPQAASTATVGGALVPLLILGIPGSAAAAVLLGVFLLHNVQPGPRIFVEQPELVYMIFGAFLLSLILMFAVGVLGAKPLIRVLSFPEVYVSAFVVLFAFIGAFALRQSFSDVWIMFAFGLIGFIMVRSDYPVAPLVLGAILGPLAERHFATAMISSRNDWSVFFTRPISGTLMVILILLMLLLGYRAYRARGQRTAGERESQRQGTQQIGDK